MPRTHRVVISQHEEPFGNAFPESVQIAGREIRPSDRPLIIPLWESGEDLYDSYRQD